MRYAGRCADPTLLRQIAAIAEPLPPIARSGPSAADVLLRGYAVRGTDGYAASVPMLNRAVSFFLHDDGDATACDQLGLAVTAAVELWDDAAVEALTARWVQLARDNGSAAALQVALFFRARFAHALGGRLGPAHAAASEAHDLAAASGTLGIVGAGTGDGELIALALAGAEAQLRASAAKVHEEAMDRRSGWLLDYAGYALGLLELGLGNYDAATHWFEPICQTDGTWSGLALTELVEAAVRAGRRDTAVRALEQLTERAGASPTPLARGLLARSRALLAGPDEAEQMYAEAIDHLVPLPHRPPRCPRAAPLRRMAAAPSPAPGGPRSAAHRPRRLRRDGPQGLRRAGRRGGARYGRALP